jgi:hypothetical protein
MLGILAWSTNYQGLNINSGLQSACLRMDLDKKSAQLSWSRIEAFQNQADLATVRSCHAAFTPLLLVCMDMKPGGPIKERPLHQCALIPHHGMECCLNVSSRS